MLVQNAVLWMIIGVSYFLPEGLAVKRPNIVIVLADDLGWNDVSFHGSNQIPTPNIDALAYNGIILNSHYVPALCTPSRASLLTGKYPTSMGMQHLVILAPEPWGLPLGETLMPQYLKRHGYVTHAIGKWHLGFHEKEYTPLYRGFDSHFGYWNGFQDYFDHTMQSESLKGYDMRRGLSVDHSSIGTYSTDAFTDEAVTIIRNHNTTQGPLFLYLSHLAPHAGNPDEPFQAPEEEIAKHSHITDPKRRIYAAMVTRLDASVGKVVATLQEKNMLDNSIILFMSDNGAVTFGMHSNQGSNYPLRGLKESPWEGGVRGVAAIWSPLLNQTHRVSNQMMHMSDWLPTLYTAAGLDTSELGVIDGMDMWNVLSNNLESPRTEVFNNYDEVEDYSSLRVDSWKYIAGTAQGGEVDLWYGETGEDGNLDYDSSSVIKSPTNEAISEYLKTESRSDFINSQVITEMRSGSVITCSYPTFSRYGLITDDHDIPSDNETTNLPEEAIEEIIQELEDIYRKYPFQGVPSNTVFTPPQRTRLRSLIQSGGLKNIFKCNPLKMVCLFNLETDPCERLNLAEIYPEVLEALEARLIELKKSVVRPLNQPDDPFSNPAFHNGTWACWCDVKKENSQLLAKLIAESASSSFYFDYLLGFLLENSMLKSLIVPLIGTFSHFAKSFFWIVTLLVSTVVVLYAVAALKRLVPSQGGDPARKKSWTNWENLTFRPITNPTCPVERKQPVVQETR